MFHLALIATLCLFGLCAEVAAESLLDWTPTHSAQVRYIVNDPTSPNPGSIRAPLSSDQPIIWSPDGRYFFFMSHRGDPKTDRVEYQLDVFAAADVRRALRAQRRGRVIKTPNPVQQLLFATGHSDDFAAGISLPRWISADEIVFVGAQDRKSRRLYRLSVPSGAVRILTAATDDVSVAADLWMTTTARGDSSIFVSTQARPWTPLDAYPMAVIDDNELWQLLGSEQEIVGTYIARSAAPAIRLDASEDTVARSPRISPDEKWAVLVYAPAGSTPDRFGGYELKPRLGLEFRLVDMQTARSVSMFEAPVGTVTAAGRDLEEPFKAFWTPDSSHVLVFNTALPLAPEIAERGHMSYIVDYSVRSRRWSVVAPMVFPSGARARRARALPNDQGVLVQYEKDGGLDPTSVVYEFDGQRWLSHSDRSVQRDGSHPSLSITIRQSAEAPPVVVASDGTAEVLLTPLDPITQNSWRPKPQLWEITEAEGRRVRGRLVLPRQEPHRALPLVIQASDDMDFSAVSRAFLPDGEGSTGFAASALAAQGFAVLTLESSFVEESLALTPDEGPAQVQRIDAAVDALAAKGFIDRDRVGLIGFSRSGYLTYYVLTHPGRTRLAAAAVFDSITASYGEYVFQAGMGDMRGTIYEHQYGRGTFWENKSRWMDAPAFNVEKAQAPVLFSTNGRHARWTMLETIGAFRINGLPFEYLHFPEGSHQLQLPRERIAAMQATIDWMNFWLRGIEREDAEADRIKRWRQMREAKDAARRHEFTET